MQKIINKLTPSNYLQFFQIARYSGLFLSGILLAKFGVSVNTIGQYEFILFLSGLISFFWIGGIFQTVVSAYHTKKDKKELLSKTINTLIALSILSSFIVFLYLKFFDHKNGFDSSTIISIIVFLLLNSITFYNEHYYLLEEKFNKLTLYGIGNFLMQILILIAALIYNPSIQNLTFALLVISVWKTIILIYNLFFEKIKIRIKADVELLKLCSPLILGILISGSADYIDSFLVLHFFGNESFAIFKYGAKEFPLSLLLANSLSMAMVPAINKREVFQEGISDLKSQSNRLMNILFPITWILLLSSKELYPLIFNAHFLQSASIFNIYLLLVISRTIFPQTVIMSLQRRDIILKTAYWEIMINVFSSYFLMLKFGIIGIAYGTFIAFLFEKLILSFHLKKLGFDFQSHTNLKRWLSYSIITLAIYTFVENFL